MVEPMLALSDGLWVPIIAVGGSFLVALFGVAFWAIKTTAETKEREATKREVAAYVAEGTISPEDAERILKADISDSRKGRNA